MAYRLTDPKTRLPRTETIDSSREHIKKLESELRELRKEYANFKNDKIFLLNKYIRENEKLKQQLKDRKQ